MIAALPALALAVVVLLTGRTGGSDGTDASAAGSPGAQPVGIAVGDRAPDFIGPDGEPALLGLDHKPIDLADFEGRPLWIVFWATWCNTCYDEAPHIESLWRAHADSGLTVLAIGVLDPESAVRAFMAQNGVDYTVALDSTAAVRDRFGGWGLPIHYFIDRTGIIRDRHIGELSAEGMEEHLSSILGTGALLPSR